MAWPCGKLQETPHKSDLANLLKMVWGPRSREECAAWQAVGSCFGAATHLQLSLKNMISYVVPLAVTPA